MNHSCKSTSLGDLKYIVTQILNSILHFMKVEKLSEASVLHVGYELFASINFLTCQQCFPFEKYLMVPNYAFILLFFAS